MARYAKVSRTTGKVIEVTEDQTTPKGDDKGEWRKVDGPVKVGDPAPPATPTTQPAEPKTEDPA